MSGPRLAVIRSGEPSTWTSCRVIANNLARAYHQALGDQVADFSLTPCMTSSEIARLASNIWLSDPAKLVFLDHSPHPGRLIDCLRNLYGERSLPSVFVHIYGEFTHRSREWVDSSTAIHGVPLRFLCASERQAALVTRFLSEPDLDRVRVCPFPVDSSRFRDAPPLRERWRRELGLRRDDFTVLYAGRITLQKNVGALVRELARVWRQFAGSSVRVFLAGSFDDLGADLFGIRPRLGSSYRMWQRELAMLPPAFRKRVTYLGEMGDGDLPGLYNAADLYANLSLLHDEDFGMAPAEALCSGTPALLTSWGGFAGFKDPSGEACDLVPTRITRRGLAIDSSVFQRAVLRRLKFTDQAAERSAISTRYRARFSIDSVAATITEAHAKRVTPFSGFNPLLSRLSKVTDRAVPFPEGPKSGTFYEKVYSAYVDGN